MSFTIRISRVSLVSWFAWSLILEANATLQLLNVAFRHGDRTPQPPLEFFPTDLNAIRSFDPPGYGKLTEAGEAKEKLLGVKLRERYNDFLGCTYVPGSINAQSTHINRTIESLNIVLQALYPQSSIPSTFKYKTEDSVLFPQACLRYAVEYRKAKKMPDVIQKLQELESFMENLSQWTGKEIKTPFDIYNIYMTLESESSMNLPLPPWAKNIYPNGDLLKGTLLEYKIMNYNQEIRRINGGMLLGQMINDMLAVRSGLMDKNRKINLFGAHDLNVVALLTALGVYSPHVPKYSSAVIIELHRIGDCFYVKVCYYLGLPAKIIDLQIPNCNTLCELDHFISLMKDVIPTEADMICGKYREKLSHGKKKFTDIVKSLKDNIASHVSA